MSAYPSVDKNPAVDRWLRIERNGRVTILPGKVDIGQRISTALAMVVAEELDVEYDRIDVLPTDTARSPDEGVTAGSGSMEQSGHAIRLAAATARARLLALAAEHLGAGVDTLEVSDGLVRARETNQTVSYAELMADRAFEVDIDLRATLKAPAAYTRVGRSPPARGLDDLVSGKTVFVHDLTRPGMLHARVIRPPGYHSRLDTLPENTASRIAPARLVRDGSFLAVAADTEYGAVQAAAIVAGAASWRHETPLDTRDVFEQLVSNRRESFPVVECVPRAEPVPPLALPHDAATCLHAVYERPYQMHAALAPSASLACFEAGALTVWAHTQGVYPLAESIATATDLDSARVRVIYTPGSGVYGHNGADDAALDAALVARALAGRPILLKWSREDEHAWEPYGPCMRMQLDGALDQDGHVVAWSHETFSPPHVTRPRPGTGAAMRTRMLATRHLENPAPAPAAEPTMNFNGGIHRNATPPYTIPSLRVVKHLVHDLPLRTSSLRTLGGYANVFAAESFMDEMASAAGVDPLAFRRRYLDDARTLAVLDAAADRFGWEPRGSRVPGRGRGLAVARYKNCKAYCAVAIEVEVTDAAEVRLLRAVAAVDAGQAVDPDGLAAQLEGGLIQAASWTLHEAVGYDGVGITTRDWDSYPILRFDNVPDIETVVVDRPGAPFLGAGEASCGPTGAAIANAVFDAVGLRVRRLPLSPDALREAASR